MDRRKFIKKTGWTSSALALGKISINDLQASEIKKIEGKLLNAYYFRAHMYTMVPRHVREDLKWMADIGTDVVTIAILEQDLFAAIENIEIICNEAAKLGIKVHAVPSRWGGLFAGAPKVPSIFSVQHPDSWVLNKDGSTHHSYVSGVISSVHYPEVYEFVCTSLDKLFKTWEIAGIVWDEPKNYIEDHSPKATENLGKEAPFVAHIQATVNFHGRLNQYIKENYPTKITSLFNYANIDKEIIDLSAQTAYLDYFGADGRPWSPEDEMGEKRGKTLLINGERHLVAAKENNKKTLWLVENHNLKSKDIPLMEKRIPEVISQDIDHLIYYYYPRSLQNPEKNMAVLGKALKAYKK